MFLWYSCKKAFLLIKDLGNPLYILRTCPGQERRATRTQEKKSKSKGEREREREEAKVEVFRVRTVTVYWVWVYRKIRWPCFFKAPRSFFPLALFSHGGDLPRDTRTDSAWQRHQGSKSFAINAAKDETSISKVRPLRCHPWRTSGVKSRHVRLVGVGIVWVALAPSRLYFGAATGYTHRSQPLNNSKICSISRVRESEKDRNYDSDAKTAPILIHFPDSVTPGYLAVWKEFTREEGRFNSFVGFSLLHRNQRSLYIHTISRSLNQRLSARAHEIRRSTTRVTSFTGATEPDNPYWNIL